MFKHLFLFNYNLQTLNYKFNHTIALLFNFKSYFYIK
ncbi:MAG: hypothetical protein JWR38_4694 [Mucilaginibacter sp.]|nr:hypothetical protein [Mucilaginibacter sp.]